MMGKIVNHIKIKFTSNWIYVFKKHEIIYSKEYFNFLIRLFKLFKKNKKLYESSLSFFFFKQNFTIIKEIMKEGLF